MGTKPFLGNTQADIGGGTTLWSTEASNEIVIGVGENTQKIEVVAVEQRPVPKTYYGAFEGW